MNKTSSQEPHVVQYESKNGDFEYARFWDQRAYEDRAERILLKKLINHYPSSADWLVDIGGSFGRLIDLYATRFNQMAIMDYATNEMHLSHEPAYQNDVSLTLIAGNAYHLPFADNSQHALMSIRVMHHLEDPGRFFQEIERSLAPGGVAIVEAANKNHLKRFLASVAKLNFKEWRADWVDVGASGVQKNKSFTLIRNYRPGYLEKLIVESGLELKQKKSISWLRQTPLSKLPVWFTDNFERFMQLGSGLTMMGPSNWYILEKHGRTKSNTTTLQDTLVDPETKKDLSATELKKKQATNHGATYYELRYPKPRV